MKSFSRFGTFMLLFVGALFIGAPGASAASVNHKGTLIVDHAVLVGQQQLPAGHYQVRWEGDGPSATVSIVNKGRAVVTTTAQVVSLKAKAAGDATDEISSAAGPASLLEARFGGQSEAISFRDAKPATATMN
jgi:hypothetical protein